MIQRIKRFLSFVCLMADRNEDLIHFEFKPIINLVAH